MTNTDKIDSLAKDLMAIHRRPLASMREAADLTGLHTNTLRRAVGRGELLASRRTPNGRMTFTLRELARWLVDGVRNSLPTPPDDDDDVEEVLS